MQGAQQRPKKKLFDPEAGDDAWKHDRFELLDLPPEEDDYRVGSQSAPRIQALLPSYLDISALVNLRLCKPRRYWKLYDLKKHLQSVASELGEGTGQDCLNPGLYSKFFPCQLRLFLSVSINIGFPRGRRRGRRRRSGRGGQGREGRK